MKSNKKKRKIKFKGLLIILLLLYLLGNIVYYIWRLPIRSINVEGNNYLKDNYIINYLNLKDESIFSLNTKEIKNSLLKLDLVSDVKIRRSIFGTLNINIKEERILFYNYNSKKYVLSNGKSIDNNNEYLGIPILINYVKDDIYKDLITKLSKVNNDILKIISEIEYSPSEINDKIVDDKRFIFRMNDGNIVYINTPNMDKINSYLEIYEGIVNKNGIVNGCLYLDSNSENKHFNLCEEARKS